MFLIAEVHPFADGNGRIARIMMNAELVHAGEERIIIPTVFRAEYLQSLKALTHNDRASALIDVLSFAQRYVSEIEFSEYDTALRMLTESKAFGKPADAMGSEDRLILPSRQGRRHQPPV
jgi:Fic family protein